MKRRNDSSQMEALLQDVHPEDQPESGRDPSSIGGAGTDEFSSSRPESSSGSSSHRGNSFCSGPSSSSSRPSPDRHRPSSPSSPSSSPRPSSSRPSSPSSPSSSPRPSSSRPSSPSSPSSSPRPSSSRSSSPSSSPRPSSSRPRSSSPSSSPRPSSSRPRSSSPSSSPRPSSSRPRPSSPSSCGQAEDSSSSCCSLKELKKLPECHNKLDPLRFSPTHSVFVDVNAFSHNGELVAQPGKDVWRSTFVKMPCSPSSVIDTKTFMFTRQVDRWESISKQLTRLSKKRTASVNDVEEAILKYNPMYRSQWSFDALATMVRRVPETDNYFGSLFPKIAALALELPNLVKKAIPMLQKRQAASITLSQVQISSLLANAFFCTFPHRNTNSPKAEYRNFPTINFSSLFGGSTEQKSEKLRAIMHYFNVMTDPGNTPQGLVTFERHVLTESETPDWSRCEEKMPKLHVTSRGSIENEGTGMLQVDFANSLIGGGVLGSGLVQEEILFLMNPELIVSRLFTEKLKDNECLLVTGAQQFSRYSGYTDKFEWAGPYKDHTPRDEWKRRQRQIVAIDAQPYKHRQEQYNKDKVKRELNKAYCGFMVRGPNKPDIATGKWGCGAFNGDPQLKAVIQLMAAAKAKRGLAFFTFGDWRLERELQQLYRLLVTEGTTVAQLFDLVENFCAVQAAGGSPHVDLFGFLTTNLRPSRSQL